MKDPAKREHNTGPQFPDPVKGLVYHNRTATPFCARCAKPIDWGFEGSELCRKCREVKE